MKTTRRLISAFVAALMIVTTFAATAVSASAAAATSEAWFDNSNYNWENVYVYAYGTKENAKWPGKLMEKTSDGLYKMSFDSTYKSENIIFNNGLEKGEGKEQYPAAAGLPLKTGECKLLTADLSWVDYGKADDHAYGFSYVADQTSFNTETIEVKLGLKNTDTGFYSIDGSAPKAFSNNDVVTVGQGKKGNTVVTLTLTATGADEVETSQTYTYKKKYTESKTTFTAESDGHTTAPEGGYYGTNPDLQLGKYKTISVDGDVSDWDSSMIIAQGVANDDPRVYMPSSMHEQPWDAYALYAAWDDNNLYFMWEMANTSYIISPSDNFAASNEARPWRNSIPMYLALSIDPTKQATGKAIGTNKDGSTSTNPFVWGCVGGVAKDGGTSFTTHVDTLIAMDSNNSNGGASIYKADVQDSDGSYLFNYDTRVPIGVRDFQAQDNQNGFKIKYANGTKSSEIIGINAPKGSRILNDNTDPNSNWVDFFDLGYKASYGFIYEVAVPFDTLGIDRDYIETNGIGAMQILTYGTSGMDTLPHDPSMLDNADMEYSYDPSTSHEKEDIDNITVPLARVGAILSDTVIDYAPFEVDFGANLNSGQAVGTEITLSADTYHSEGDVTYTFSVNGKTIQSSSSASCKWVPSESGVYTIGITAVDSKGNECSSEKTFVAGEVKQEYALGDIDLSGNVDIKDATALQKSLAGLFQLNSAQVAVADVNKNGVIEIGDATSIQYIIAGLSV